jgi:transcriptional regulator with XRE-family HTH domain
MAATFGEKLIYLRKQRGWSQTELAKKALIPVPTLNALEHGTRSGTGVAVGTAQKLARVLGVTLDYLTGMYDYEDTVSEPEGAETATVEP